PAPQPLDQIRAENARSGAQPLTAACPPRRDHPAPAFGCHAGAKAVPTLAHQFARLIGPLHERVSGMRGLYGTPFREVNLARAVQQRRHAHLRSGSSAGFSNAGERASAAGPFRYMSALDGYSAHSIPAVRASAPAMTRKAREVAVPSPTIVGPARLRRFVPFAIVLIVLTVILATGWHRQLSFETLVRHRVGIDAFMAQHYAAALAGFVAIYVTTAALSVPGAAVLTICGGVLFGWLAGGLAAVVGATTGATIIFSIARTACGESLIRCAGSRAESIAEGLRSDAFSYLLFLRLVPIFPFWLVNLAPAVVGVRLATFV